MKKSVYVKIMMFLGLIFPLTIKADFTAVTAGDWTNPATWGGSAPPVTVSEENITIPEWITVNLDTNIVFAGSPGSNQFTINGTLSNTSDKGLTILSGELAGDGVIAIKWIAFKQVATVSFTGLMNVKSLSNETPLLSIGNTLNITDTLDLRSGVLSLEDSSDLVLHINSTYKAGDGTLVLNGGTFNQSYPYHVMYVGSSKNTGIELEAINLRNLYINMDPGETVTLSKDTVTVNGEFVMNSGKLALNGKRLKLRKTFYQNPATKINADPNAELFLNLTSVDHDTIWFENALNNYHTLKSLRVNHPDSDAFVIGSKLIIKDDLTFVNGKIEIGNNDLTILPLGTITGCNDTQYVVSSGNGTGNLVMNVNAGAPYIHFPLGNAVNYSPVYIQQDSAAGSGNFKVRITDKVYAEGFSGFVSSDISKVIDRTWHIDADVAIQSKVKLAWTDAAELNGFDRTDAYIGQYTSAGWDLYPTGSSVAGANNTYELERTGLTTAGPLAVIQSGEAVMLQEPVAENRIDVFPNPFNEYIHIRISDNAAFPYKYELVDLTGKTIISGNENNSGKIELAQLNAGCYFVKVTNLRTNKTFTKKLIKE